MGRLYGRSEALKVIGMTAIGGLLFPGAAIASPKKTRERICRTGRKYLGTDYVHNGTSLNHGVDCDAYVHGVFKKCKIDIPADLISQSRGGHRRRGKPREGDLVFFAEGGGREITHVAIYSGEGNILHASDYFDEVKESKMKHVNNHVATRVYR